MLMEFAFFPKLPVHFCTHLRNWLKKNRIKNSVKAAKKGADKLKDINEALSPFYSKQSPLTPAALASALADTALAQAGVDATSRTQSSAFPVVLHPPMMPQPAQKAMHNKPHTIVGSTMMRSNTCQPRRGGAKT